MSLSVARAARIALALALAAIAAPASAETAPATDLVARPLVLPARAVEARAVVEVGLAIRRVGAPTSIAPDVFFGATGALTVGLVHSASGQGLIAAGRGYCVRDDRHGCPRAYDNVGLDARWSLRGGGLAVAAHGRLLARSFEPFKPRAAAGALLRWTRGRFAVIADPMLSVGLANRDRGNRAELDVPLWLAAQPTCRWALHVRTGVHGTLGLFRDVYEVPIGLGVTAAAHRRVDVSAEASFRRLLGPLNDFKTRAGWVAVTVRWP